MINNSSFNNYKNKAKQFDSFNGTELKCFMKVPTKYDVYGRVVDFELAELGTASAISAFTQYAIEPLPTIGSSHPTGIAKGSSIVRGSIVFEIFNEGFVNEVKHILKEAGLTKIDIDFDTKDSEFDPKYTFNDIDNINDFPNVDIIIIGVKENNPNKKIEKQILNIRFNKGSSGIGITQLSVREKYDFLAAKLEDFKPVIGAEETDIEPEKEKTSAERMIFL